MKQTIKKFTKFITSRTLYLCVGIFIALAVFVVQASLDDYTVVDGDPLTPAFWNGFKDEIKSMWNNDAGVNDIYTMKNVGIGTTTPAVMLDVNSTSNVAAIIRSSRGEYVNIGAGLTTEAPYIWSSSGNFFIGDDLAPTLYIAGMGNGNVGIGTTNPQSKLSVSGLPTAPSDGTVGLMLCVDGSGNFWIDGDGIFNCL